MASRNITKLHTRLTTWALCAVLCIGFSSTAFAGKDAGKDVSKAAQQVSVTDSAGISGINSMPRLGVEVDGSSSDVVVQTAAGSGAKLARVYVAWSSLEPVNTDPAHYRWGAFDRLFNRLAANNFQVMVTISTCPTWACGHINGPLFDDKYSEFAQFMGAMATRYSRAPYTVHYWEMWNEPDNTKGVDGMFDWGRNADKYVRMLAAARPAVKAADPDSVIMTGGLAYDFWTWQGGPFNEQFLANVLDAGGAQYLDAVAFHYYVNNAHGWTNIGLKTAVIRSVINQHGANLPLVVSEAGLTSDPQFGSSEEIQARYAVQMNVVGAANGLHAQVWYLNKDFATTEPGWQVFSKCGLTYADNTPKPSYTTMQVLSREVGSGAYLRALNSYDGVTGSLEGYRFVNSTGNTHVSVVWNNGSGESNLTIPAAQVGDFSRAVSLYGQALQPQAGPGGTLVLPLGADPIYLEWSTRFEDVSLNSWAYTYVEYLASRGIVAGYTDGTYRPGNSATRGQFSKMLVLGMGWTPDNSSQPHFADVPAGSTFYGYIQTAFNRGIISGYQCGGATEPCPGNYFRPDSVVTRGQISKMVVGAKGWQVLNPARATFSDVPVGSTFYGYVETMVSHSIVSGYTDGTFRPGNNATRGQLSKMLALSLQQP